MQQVMFIGKKDGSGRIKGCSIKYILAYSVWLHVICSTQASGLESLVLAGFGGCIEPEFSWGLGVWKNKPLFFRASFQLVSTVYWFPKGEQEACYYWCHAFPNKNRENTLHTLVAFITYEGIRHSPPHQFIIMINRMVISLKGKNYRSPSQTTTLCRKWKGALLQEVKLEARDQAEGICCF